MDIIGFSLAFIGYRLQVAFQRREVRLPRGGSGLGGKHVHESHVVLDSEKASNVENMLVTQGSFWAT